jgi:hypothetical protein
MLPSVTIRAQRLKVLICIIAGILVLVVPMKYLWVFLVSTSDTGFYMSKDSLYLRAITSNPGATFTSAGYAAVFSYQNCGPARFKFPATYGTSSNRTYFCPRNAFAPIRTESTSSALIISSRWRAFVRFATILAGERQPFSWYVCDDFVPAPIGHPAGLRTKQLLPTFVPSSELLFAEQTYGFSSEASR